MTLDELYKALVVRHPMPYRRKPRVGSTDDTAVIPKPPRLDWTKVVVLPNDGVEVQWRNTPARLRVNRYKRPKLQLLGQFAVYWLCGFALLQCWFAGIHTLIIWFTGDLLVPWWSVPIFALILSPLPGLGILKAHVRFENRKKRKTR